MIRTIDLDLVKLIFGCRAVVRVRWRVSASGKGFHFAWECPKRRCQWCSHIERQFDDPRRLQRDLALRKPHQRRVLWDSKAGRKAGAWRTVRR